MRSPFLVVVLGAPFQLLCFGSSFSIVSKTHSITWNLVNVMESDLLQTQNSMALNDTLIFAVFTLTPFFYRIFWDEKWGVY
jgi:hypothetical protein